MTNYQLAEKDYKAGMKYKEIAQKYGVTLNTVKSWKTRYWNDEKKKKVCTPNKKSMHTKKVKEIAKEMIIAGASISETVEQTGIPRATVGRWSSEYNLQAKQLEFLKEFRDKQRERILQNKTKRLEINEEALKAIYYEVMNWKENGKISKALMEKLIMNEELEQLILGLDRIERLEKLEIERAKNKTEKIEDKKPIFIAGGGELED
ncbi:helix-turn-helix domain-containing protein [Fusobacterium mortiferum]|uniref:helix-turn-helix domain-containing protein n=1 Tax=Fusobacterium mortiferum TaxID=850 RepID=UPI001C9C4ABD|nr:helix-turn-helix domain-containing protein [Fusobacterium mortiferum]